MESKDLYEARTNSDFLEYLKKKEEEVILNEDLEGLYEVLDNLLILDLDEKRVEKVYNKILEVAFSSMDNRLLDDTKLSLLNDDLYLIRAFYEYAIEKWSIGKFDKAKQIFFILSQIIEDKKIKDSIKVHLIKTINVVDIDIFYDKDISVNQMDDDEKYGYFIINFNFDTKEYLNQNKELLGNALDELSYLLD
jgi:hypothetical protein